LSGAGRNSAERQGRVGDRGEGFGLGQGMGGEGKRRCPTPTPTTPSRLASPQRSASGRRTACQRTFTRPTRLSLAASCPAESEQRRVRLLRVPEFECVGAGEDDGVSDLSAYPCLPFYPGIVILLQIAV
jgi:hypothetical protein